MSYLMEIYLFAQVLIFCTLLIKKKVSQKPFKSIEKIFKFLKLTLYPERMMGIKNLKVRL